MFNIIKKTIQYPRLTLDYPYKPLDSQFITGKPVIDWEKCSMCGECVKSCPSSAIVIDNESKSIGINYDECIFCSNCEDVCQKKAITMSKEFELAAKSRQEIRKSPLVIEARSIPDESFEVLGKKVDDKARKIFGRSLQIREVDAGSCNGCDYEINALNNPFNDIERFGVHFVASPRHADMLLVTGTATRNMELALIKTYNAAPDPKLVVAVGACACSGGIFKDMYATRNGIDCILPVDIYIPGCPPRPHAILYGILKAMDRL
ncbi:NADH-quinone oxidoreductase subunit NuoB [Pseudobacteroides cellulosolvens]|uniref:NADH ubiquinone oxidoreductase 20 kDa subunit n=1 Tax=Pseudobacteroides cellulosolvens ATCC 35603 = DSM 2933 TaxID=398512 RepID=A0A0L6JVY8_9FIRM|nr:NADH-quinone oxidoreductase subunit NuoB [Pseudobacteroides cellulosolvens]KNY29775.1 NADH ubiquinone oxidoreductase 20 kDa subunit [Pseudobacteroides cellulosolvens ATCC 35603 = DSM 2933]